MNKTSDISDFMHPKVQYLDPIYKSFGAKKSFHGIIQTVSCFEDNSFVKEKVSSNGKGYVLVVDAKDSKRSMLGDLLATKAMENGWSGLVINGFIRDISVIN